MKNYEVTYTKGHLVDVKTGKRIFLRRGGLFNLLGDDDQFSEKDELQIRKNPLDSKEKLLSLQKQHKRKPLEKIANSGQKFIYRIGLSIRTSEDKRMEFLFDAIILEDLYLYKVNKENWALCECLCETRNCLDGELQMIETIPGKSLSNLFSNVVAFYFPLQRSGSINAFNHFYFAEHDGYKLSDVKNRVLMPLAIKRENVKIKYRLNQSDF